MTTPNTPEEKPQPKKIATCCVWKSIPSFMGSGKVLTLALYGAGTHK